MLIRQGDVLLVRVERPPRGRSVPREDGRLVLATGEVTGHGAAVAWTFGLDEHEWNLTAES